MCMGLSINCFDSSPILILLFKTPNVLMPGFIYPRPPHICLKTSLFIGPNAGLRGYREEAYTAFHVSHIDMRILDRGCRWPTKAMNILSCASGIFFFYTLSENVCSASRCAGRCLEVESMFCVRRMSINRQNIKAEK